MRAIALIELIDQQVKTAERLGCSLAEVNNTRGELWEIPRFLHEEPILLDKRG